MSCFDFILVVCFKDVPVSIYLDAFRDSGNRSIAEPLAVYRPSPRRR